MKRRKSAASGCVFCDIISGVEPAHFVMDDVCAVAVLDVRPLFEGHVLLLPREHHETLADLPVEQVGPLFSRSRLLSAAAEAALGAHGTFVAMNNRVSQSVPHLHIHVVPRRFKDGLRGFFWPRTRYRDDQHAADTARKLSDCYNALSSSLG